MTLSNHVSRHRFIVVRLPYFAVERLRHDPLRPLAAVCGRAGRLTLAAVNRAAAEAGCLPGMTLANAFAISPGMDTVDADPQGAVRDMGRLADWCGRYTPLVGLHGTEALLLDITGAGHLFGGEAAMLERVCGDIGRLGHTVCAALADTPLAALAFARCGSDARIVPPGEHMAHMGPLPVAALGLDGAVVERLAVFGLRRIGDLAALPRGPLAVRAGPAVLMQLDRALGRRRDPMVPHRAPPSCRLSVSLPDPVATREDIDRLARRLVRAACRTLERRRQGVRRLRLAFHTIDGKVRHAEAATVEPVRDAGHLLRLLTEPLAGIDPDPGIEAAVLTVPEAGPFMADQSPLPRLGTAASADGPKELGQLIDRLTARLGAAAVMRQSPRESHLPERAVERSVPLDGPTRIRPHPQPRPIRLLAGPEPVRVMAMVPDGPPLRFRWRRRDHLVRRAEGPERIGCEWWRERAETRDYYRVEDETGARFWIFRAGPYRSDRMPEWYVQGIFA